MCDKFMCNCNMYTGCSEYFLFVLRDGFRAGVTWQPCLIQIRKPCAKCLRDVFVLFFFFLLKSEGQSVGIKPDFQIPFVGNLVFHTKSGDPARTEHYRTGD